MKRIVIVLTIFLLLFSSTAVADEYMVETGKIEEKSSENEVSPCFTYLGYMSAALDIDENGHVTFTGSACAPYRNVRLKLYLQRSRNQLIWDDIYGSIKTEYDNALLEEEYNVSEDDYFYRTKVIAEVLDDNKNVIETATVYSDTERY